MISSILFWWFIAAIGAGFVNYALMQFTDNDDDN